MDSTDCRVLLVDDDSDMLRILAMWLEAAGYQVQTAGDGEEALAIVEADCPQFVITDRDVPRMDGAALCRRIRELPLSHYVYILFLTVKSTPEEIASGLETGADEYLAKPVQRNELLARMHAGTRVLALERRLSLAACTDPLTGLANQRAFFKILEKEWYRARRYRLPLSCVMMDLDFFKRINDIHGHPAGDQLLKRVSDLLKRDCRGCDTACRYGGEEFCILLPETPEEQAALWAERVRQGLAALRLSHEGKEIRVTGSFGVAQPLGDTQSAEELVDLADQALLCAKQSGRDRVVRHSEMGDGDELELDPANLRRPFHGVVARHVMTPLVVCLREEETVGQAAEFFLRSRITSAPVVDEFGQLRGMLSEKDLMAAMVSLNFWQRPVREVMKPNVISYEEETPVRTIYEFLCRVSISRVVIAKEGRPTGIVSRGTLLRWFRNLVILPEWKSDAAEQLDRFRSQERLAETARELARQASSLEQRVQASGENPIPYLVGSASGMQELVNDLLAFSRYAGGAGLAAEEPMLINGGRMD